jgi:tRNA-2-methylthio-N6-dimethylallyladenosine synthase
MNENHIGLKNMKFFIRTFGCQMNDNDSERIAGLLAASGAQKTENPEESDVIIINTCAVREKSEEKLYSYLGRLQVLKKKKKLVIGVVGCIAQIERRKLFKKCSFVDFILGPDNYLQLPEFVARGCGEKFAATNWSRHWQETPPVNFIHENPASAYVTIMEGCNHFCSYCIVPFARGREKCRPLEYILAEIEDLSARGYKEVQLLGQNVNSYRNPETGQPFPELLRAVSRIKGIDWIRFITSHPQNFSQEIIEAMDRSEKICRQLHLPLQSGSTSVLQRMNRGYSREDYLDIIRRLRALMPDICLSTDIIVGFPGETDQEFEATLSALIEIRFVNIFSFRYSPRPHTAASRLKDDVPWDVKKSRLLEVQRLQKEIQTEFHRSLVGRTLKVLCTGRSKKDPLAYSGRSEGYQVVNFKSDGDVIGRFVEVRISAAGPYSLQGELPVRA